LYISGTIVFTFDPLSYRLENIRYDSKNILSGFTFSVNWGYPEAYLTPTSYVDNLTIHNSATVDTSFRPELFKDSGPGNITFKNIIFKDHYNTLNSGTRAFSFIMENTCNPDDTLTKFYNFKNLQSALVNNDLFSKTNILAIDCQIVSTRNWNVTVDNFYFDIFKNSSLPGFSSQGTINNELTVK